MTREPIPFSKLPLSNDFMFGAVMSQSEICKPFLEALLQTEIENIVYINRQEDITSDHVSHGIRLDVFLKDGNGTRYIVEMQVTKQKRLERRIRDYQSTVDRESFTKGMEYKDMPDSYIIFICDFDYFKKGLAYYERVSTIKDCDGLVYNDGSHVIILNSDYKNPNAPEPVLEFLKYIKTKDDTLPMHTDLMEKVKTAMFDIRNDKRREMQYMTLEMKYQDIRMQEHERTRTEDLIGAIQMLRKARFDDDTIVSMIAEQYDLTPEEADELIERCNNAT